MADPNARRGRLLEVLYRTFGVGAEWTAAGGGSAVPCTVRPAVDDDQLVGLGRGDIIAQRNLLKVRVSEVAAPAVNGIFALTDDARLFKVMGTPRRAHSGLEWVCEVKEVAP